MPYQLYYWPFLPGRGEYVRLVLEEAGVEYVDLARQRGATPVRDVMDGRRGDVAAFAPPFLFVDDNVIAQTAAICHFVGTQHGLVPDDPVAQAQALALMMTVMDATAEAHDTHHPVSGTLYYEDQKDEAIAAAALFRERRLPRFLPYFERSLALPFSYAHIALAHLVAGLHYAFPTAMRGASPALDAHRDAVFARPRIAAYRASDRCLGFNEHGVFRYYPELDGSA